MTSKRLSPRRILVLAGGAMLCQALAVLLPAGACAARTLSVAEEGVPTLSMDVNLGGCGTYGYEEHQLPAWGDSTAWAQEYMVSPCNTVTVSVTVSAPAALTMCSINNVPVDTAPLVSADWALNVQPDARCGFGEEWSLSRPGASSDTYTFSLHPAQHCAYGYRVHAAIAATYFHDGSPPECLYNENNPSYNVYVNYSLTYTLGSEYASAATPQTPSLKGGPGDNPNTVFRGGDGPGSCSIDGLPNYFVNTATLNLVVQDTDFSYAGLGPDPRMTRTWNADPATSGIFGNGWSFEYASKIRSHGGAGGNASVVKGSGQEIYFSHASHTTDAGGETTAVFAPRVPGNFDTLTGHFGASSSYWLLTEKGTGETLRYDYEGAAGDFELYRLVSITDRNGNALTVAYGADGTIASVVDAAGRATTFAYDGNRRCVSMTTPQGKVATYAYDTAGNLVQSVDLLGTAIGYTYDAGNYLTSITVGDKTTSFTYGASGGWTHVASVTDANGQTTSYTALSAGSTRATDPRGNTTAYGSSGGTTASVTDALGTVRSWSYAGGLPVSFTDGRGGTTTMTYDGRGNLTGRTDALGKATTRAYDAADRLTSVTDALGATWSYAYDGKGNLTGITSPLGGATLFAYDAKGQPLSVTDPSGRSWTAAYDPFGNQISVTDPLGKSTTYGYDASGINRVSATDPRGNQTRFAYDNNRRLTQVTHPDGAVTTFAYDACALASVTDGNGHAVTLSRDKLLNVTGLTDALGRTTSKSYDGSGNLLAITDPLSRAHSFTYDAADRLAAAVDPSSRSLQFSYDGNGNLLSLLDARAKQTSFTYDAADGLVGEVDPLGRTVAYTRDALGRVALVTRPDGATVGFAYNADGLLASKAHSGSTVATYGYDAAGRRTAVTDATGTRTFGYDAAGRLSGIGHPGGAAVAFAYDDAGNVASVGYPGGVTVAYAYDSRNRVSSVGWGGQTVSYAYDAAGNLLSTTRSNGTTTSRTYDANDRVASITHAKGGVPFAQMAYTRNTVGLTVAESATLPLAPSASAADATAAYNDANQITTYGASAYTYDANGNLSAVSGGRTLAAAYDAENRLTAITLDGAAATHLYDGTGLRSRSVRGARTTVYHHDPAGRLLFTTDGSGNPTAYYVHGARGLEALQTAAGAVAFYHFDKTGNTVALTDGAGNVVNAYAYDPFGAVSAKTESVANPFTYVGAFGVTEEGGGIYHMKHRAYDATTGKFLQKDPIGFAGGFNLYDYVGGNPVERIDPQGLCDPIFCLGGAILTAGTIIIGIKYLADSGREMSESGEKFLDERYKRVKSSDKCYTPRAANEAQVDDIERFAQTGGKLEYNLTKEVLENSIPYVTLVLPEVEALSEPTAGHAATPAAENQPGGGPQPLGAPAGANGGSP